MNTYKYKLLALAVVSALGLAACGGDDDPEVVVPPPPPPVVVAPTTPAPLAFVVTGGITNASTGNVITFTNATAGTVTLSFKEGDAASANVVDLSGAAITSLTTIDGSFAFRLKSGATPTNFSVVVSAPGYLTKSYILDLSDTTQPISTLFELVATNAAGVVAATQATAVTAGTVATEVTAEASANSTSAGVTIPAGTVLQNAAGAAVAGTQVNLNIATAAQTGTGATLSEIIPQGLNLSTDNLVRVPVAGASVTMTDNQGNKVKKFSSPINVSLNVPAGSGVDEGDVVSISSYDEDTGVWTRDEFSATLGALNTTTNTYPASFQTSHLTFFGAGRRETVCPVAMTYNVTGAAVPTGGLSIYIESSDAIAAGGIAAGVTSGTLFGAATVARFGIYNNAAARVMITARNDKSVVWYDSQTEVSICGAIPLVLTNPNATPVNEDFNVNLVCSNDTTVTKALTGALVSYGLAGKAKVKANDNNDGSYSLTGLVQGSSYEVKVQPVGVTGAATTNFTVTANGAEETGTINIACQTATGAG